MLVLNITFFVFIVWSLVGVVHFWCGKTPQSRLGIVLNAAASGPIIWGLCLVAGVFMLFRAGDYNLYQEQKDYFERD